MCNSLRVGVMCEVSALCSVVLSIDVHRLINAPEASILSEIHYEVSIGFIRPKSSAPASCVPSTVSRIGKKIQPDKKW